MNSTQRVAVLVAVGFRGDSVVMAIQGFDPSDEAKTAELEVVDLYVRESCPKATGLWLFEGGFNGGSLEGLWFPGHLKDLPPGEVAVTKEVDPIGTYTTPSGQVIQLSNVCYEKGEPSYGLGVKGSGERVDFEVGGTLHIIGYDPFTFGVEEPEDVEAGSR